MMRVLGVVFLLSALACAPDPLDEVAKGYAALVRASTSSANLSSSPRSLLDELEGLEPSPRRERLRRGLLAMEARLDPSPRTFDEESERLYGVVAPLPDLEAAREVREELDSLLPGEGDLHARLLAFEKRFLVPNRNLESVFARALRECRRRTREHLALPESEDVTIEYVRGKPWPSFSTYLGDYQSRVELNRDFPMTLGKVLEIAAHEAYPGHHVGSVLRERDLVRGKGLFEFSVEPEVGPDALVREGLATVAIELAFSEKERLAFEKEVLFPLAGIPPDAADRYAEVERLVKRLESLTVDGARQYVDGKRDRVQSVLWLEREALVLDPWAFLGFVDRYRAYVVTYTLGAERIRARLRTDPDPWRAYSLLLLSTDHET